MVNAADYEGLNIERGKYMTRWWNKKRKIVRTDWYNTRDVCFKNPVPQTIEDYPELKWLILKVKIHGEG